MPDSKKSSLKSVALAVQQHKNEVPDKKTLMVRNLVRWKQPKNNNKNQWWNKNTWTSSDDNPKVHEMNKCSQQW